MRCANPTHRNGRLLTRAEFPDAGGPFCRLCAGEDVRVPALAWGLLRPTHAGQLARFLCHALALPGDVAEFGVFEGHTAAALAQLMAGSGKTLHLFESCIGLPACSVQDILDIPVRPVDPQTLPQTAGLYAVSAATVRQALANSPTSWILHTGWFHETCPGFRQPLCCAHVDCDLYASTRVALETCTRVLVVGGALVIHDYLTHWHGVTRAVDEICTPAAWTCVGDPAIDGQLVLQRIA